MNKTPIFGFPVTTIRHPANLQNQSLLKKLVMAMYSTVLYKEVANLQNPKMYKTKSSGDVRNLHVSVLEFCTSFLVKRRMEICVSRSKYYPTLTTHHQHTGGVAFGKPVQKPLATSVKQNGNNIINKKGESQILFAMYISLRFSAWVFSPFSPEMYKIIAIKGV